MTAKEALEFAGMRLVSSYIARDADLKTEIREAYGEVIAHQIERRRCQGQHITCDLCEEIREEQKEN